LQKPRVSDGRLTARFLLQDFRRLKATPKKPTASRGLSRRQAQDLDIEIGFLEGVVRRDPRFVEALQLLGDDYTRRGRYKRGLEVDQRLVKLRPQDSVTHYNLACSLALTHEPAQAIVALHRALDLGYSDFKWLKRDPDLRALRRHPLFKSIRDRIRSLGEART
jgi:predicted Zn-dependent protease